MLVMDSDDNTWSLIGRLAELRSSRLSASIDVSRPDLGARQLQVGELALPGYVLAVERQVAEAPHQSRWPLTVADAYVRGRDLISTYAPCDDWPFAPQIYWSVTESSPEAVVSLSLVVSVQTHLLDTRPRIRVVSRLPTEEILVVEPNGSSGNNVKALDRSDQDFAPSGRALILLRRLAGCHLSYVEVMPASDFQEAAAHWPEEEVCKVHWMMFADFLEKGVIWRARLHSLFIPRINDIELAAEFYNSIEKRPLPLTV